VMPPPSVPQVPAMPQPLLRVGISRVSPLLVHSWGWGCLALKPALGPFLLFLLFSYSCFSVVAAASQTSPGHALEGHHSVDARTGELSSAGFTAHEVLFNCPPLPPLLPGTLY